MASGFPCSPEFTFLINNVHENEVVNLSLETLMVSEVFLKLDVSLLIKQLASI